MKFGYETNATNSPHAVAVMWFVFTSSTLESTECCRMILRSAFFFSWLVKVLKFNKFKDHSTSQRGVSSQVGLIPAWMYCVESRKTFT